MFQSGTYRGTAEARTYEFRLESVNDGEWFLSGDVTRGTELIVSFVCEKPVFSTDGTTLSGAIVFRGNAGLFTGTIHLTTDDRGLGSFQLGVDMEGGHRDLIAGRLDWQGAFLRRLLIEIDGLPGTKAPVGYRSRSERDITIERAFEQIGFDVGVVVDRFGVDRGHSRARGYTLAEIHTAMERVRGEVPADRLHAHVFVCSYLAGRGNRGVLGVMYDFGSADLNRRPREGVAVFYDHPLLSDPRTPNELREREYIFTIVHEVGHALNLLHSFDKARPAALSWMNYPHLYPRGYEATAGYDGTKEFWRSFAEGFDDEELRHLRHASPREIMAGGFAFGTYEEGLSIPFGGTADPRRTGLGANPLRSAPGVVLQIQPGKREYDLGEPVFIGVRVMSQTADPVHVPDALDPAEGYLRFLVRHPSGHVARYRPPVRLCKEAQRRPLRFNEEMSFDGVPMMLGADGAMFTEPGTYVLVAQLAGINGTETAQSVPVSLRIRVPDRDTERAAETLWTNEHVVRAMYLRHPLVDRDAWGELEQELTRYKLAPENRLPAYLDYVAGLGWMTPFDTGFGTAKSADPRRVADRFAAALKKGVQDLPSTVTGRIDRVLKQPDIAVCGRRTVVVKEARAKRKAARKETGWAAVAAPESAETGEDGRNIVVSRAVERVRAEVPPAGLFGSIGFGDDVSAGSFDPFARIVPSLRGRTRFADVVSWNIEHLHRDHWKIPRVAELIRDFRCDFWGLQEIDGESLAIVAETLNSSGQIRYRSVAVDGKGQQSGVLFRTDTTRVRRLPVPQSIFGREIDVEYRNGDVKRKRVFLRDPFLCEVTVRQNGAAFDFRCAVVHLKSTDTSIRDNGNAWRLAAARALGRWIEEDQDETSEREYLIMGDMNAETAQQGLKPLEKGHRLLSVGMKEEYGEDQALTRVASKRLLDHIVVTGDALVSMPEEDLEEQLIIRSDMKIGDWTKELSDHVPVAVRLLLAKKDTD